jgi:HEAT repeat protein
MESLKNPMRSFLLSSFLFLSSFNSEATLSDKKQILYLAQANHCEESIQLYRNYQKKIGRHDFEVLQQIATIWIEQCARDKKPEKQILGLFGFSIAGLSAPPDILENAIVSSDPSVQSAAIGFIGKMQEDYSDILLNKAMSSQSLYTRLEAAFYLSQRKAPTATGQIESLMYRLPPQMRYFFPQFFAIIGTTEAVHVLRHLMDDSFHLTKIEAILNAARYGRDDLLPAIRAGATHLDNPEQEACAAALGYLKDMRSMKKLKKLANHPSTTVQLAALQALFALGDTSATKLVAKEAATGNLLAISLLGEMPGHEDTLFPLSRSNDMQVRFNAAVSLLKKKDPRSLPPLIGFLIKDSKDIGFQPILSPGGALRAWKVVPSLKQHAKESFFDMEALTIAVKENILQEALELPEESFLWLTEKLFNAKQNDLVPILVSSLENLRTEKAIALLRKESQKMGAPLIRAYCNLALFNLKEEGPYQRNIIEFLKENRSKELIRLRSTLPWNMRLSDSYHLTPEESSSLLIRSYEALSEKLNEEGIDILLEAVEKGLEHNRAVLAGILIHTMH